MKQLEKTLKQVTKEEINPGVDKPIYGGFRLIEEKTYQGPTSIKYWM